jgi:hypothetical protein
MLTSLNDLSLSQIFQELPSLVETDGLFVDVTSYGQLQGFLGEITFAVKTYRNSAGFLKESRLLRKMRRMPACVLPCTYCAEPGPPEATPDTCPLCLAFCATPSWKKASQLVKVAVSLKGELTIDGSFAHALLSFLSPLFLKAVKRHEELVAAAAARAAAEAAAAAAAEGSKTKAN